MGYRMMVQDILSDFRNLKKNVTYLTFMKKNKNALHVLNLCRFLILKVFLIQPFRKVKTLQSESISKFICNFS